MNQTVCLFMFLVAFRPAIAEEIAIVDGDTLKIGEFTYRLHGIDAPEAGQKCKSAAGGKDWPCGNQATARLRQLVEGRQVVCDDREEDDYDRLIAVCQAGGIELNRTMVAEGMAWAFVKYSTDYVDDERQARAAGNGVWRAPSETPWDYRARRWHVEAQVAPEGCPIKGNISRNGRIYHTPWSPWYTRTRVSTNKGERWFCSERDALNAGWRAPVWGSQPSTILRSSE